MPTPAELCSDTVFLVAFPSPQDPEPSSAREPFQRLLGVVGAASRHPALTSVLAIAVVPSRVRENSCRPALAVSGVVSTQG